MTKIQLKRIYNKIYKYNKTDIIEYDNIKDIAHALESKYTLSYNNINEKNQEIYYNEFIVKCCRLHNKKFVVGNIVYFTKNNQIRQLF